MRTRSLTVLGFVVVSLMWPGFLAAQSCGNGGTIVGSLGMTGFSCSSCTYRSATPEREGSWSFHSEPEVLGVTRGSAADGKLQAGDQIIGIDGYLITTSRGGRAIANLPPSETISVAIRRNGQERLFDITTEPRCSTEESAPVAFGQRSNAVTAPAPPSPTTGINRSEPQADAAPPAPAAPPSDVEPLARGLGVPRASPPRLWLPDGWFGIGIRCMECSFDVDDEQHTSHWSFSAPPSITSVEPGGPADRAGLRRGDVILEVDGKEITSDEGGRRFGSAQPGEPSEWTIERGGSSRQIHIAAEARPSAEIPPAVTPSLRGAPDVPMAEPTSPALGPNGGVAPPPGPYALRYAGTVGDADIEVRSAGSVIVNVIEAGRAVEIVTGDSRTTIRLAKDDK